MINNRFGLPVNQLPKGRRKIMVAGVGETLIGADVKAAESHIVSYVTGDEGYIAAHEGGWDTHTLVCKLALPHLDWPSDDPRECRAYCEGIVSKSGKLRGHTLRQVFKHVQHASNYLGTPYTVANQAGISIAEAEEFQTGYFTAFPRIPEYHEWLRQFVRKHKAIVIPGYNFVRETFERPWAETTVRELMANIPQGLLALYVHEAMFNIWEKYECDDFRYLLHNHDQLVFSTTDTEKYSPLVRQEMEHPLDIEDFSGTIRTMTLRVDLKTGHSWKDVS